MPPPGEEAPEASEAVKVETKEDFWRVQIEAIYRRRSGEQRDRNDSDGAGMLWPKLPIVFKGWNCRCFT